ncbi:serine palmitoyltransferase component [Ceratocystis pirilliformis]|uniref:Serine palmitoyltransferase component n=1 Tax=Ceratocystis pirilliformis TaxID=259994 RepID=A0ABR3ZC85_9PEZI
MPRKVSNTISSASSSTAVMTQTIDEVTERRLSISSKNRLALLGSESCPSHQQALRVAQEKISTSTPQQDSSPSSSLPAISLSPDGNDCGSKLDGARSSEKVLFKPPTEQELARQRFMDAQFGPLTDPTDLYVSQHHGEPLAAPIIDEPSYYFILTTYISYLLFIILGHVRDFFGKRFGDNRFYAPLKASNGYAPLNEDFDSFYVRRLKIRLDDCFARLSTGVPGRYIKVMDRISNDWNRSFVYTGSATETLNMSSYNYLGFAQSEGPCADAVEECVKTYGVSCSSPRADAGTSDLALEVEKEIANFVGKPAAMVFSMGFVTNSSSFPALVSKGCLIISDELNHSSIRIGARFSGAVIRAFKHNDMKDLERTLRDAIAQGQPRTHRPWKKILVAVEGLYSMEGTMCDLPGLLELKKRYKFYLFIDEAHSIGALGPRGRGVCDYFGINPAEVDILMGTLTKSFGANGGYVAAEEHVISQLKSTNAATQLGEAPTPPVLMQILASLKMITGELFPGQGKERLQRIAFNSRYLRLGLKRLGFIVYGHDDSPIIPAAVYNPGKMAAFSQEMLNRKISVVIVGYPATPLISSRVRFCISAAHNKEDLNRLLMACDEVGDLLQLKYSSGISGGQPPLPEGVTPETEAEWRKANNLVGQYVAPRWKIEDVLACNAEDAKHPLR